MSFQFSSLAMPNLYLVKLPLPYHAEALKHNGISDLTKSTVRVCPLPLGVVVFEGAMVDVVGRCLCGFNRCHFYAPTLLTLDKDNFGQTVSYHSYIVLS